MTKNKKLSVKTQMLIASVLFVMILITILLFSSSYKAVIMNSESRFFKADILLLVSDHLICLRDIYDYRKRKNALKSQDYETDLAIISMKDVINIEIIQDPDDKIPTMDKDIPTKYLGKFKANVTGNIGYLYLSKKKNKIFGTIRFPGWANGSYERLKNLWISKGKIGFIRSIDSAAEAKRVGTSTYFVQEFYGDYKRKGNMIEGYYMNRGEKNVWRAYRIK